LQSGRPCAKLLGMDSKAKPKRFVVAVTGASGSLYAQRLLDALDGGGHEVHVALSPYAQQVARTELDGGLSIPEAFHQHGDKSMNVPFASGSALMDAMVIIPCSMGTLGRIAHGYADSVITRAADVFLKEKRPLIIVPRETPWNLIQARNVVAVMEAGAHMIPAMPSFYHRPGSLEEIADTLVARVLDHLGVEHDLIKRWMEPDAQE